MKQKILFLCTGNSCRSQMAEGWAKHLLGDLVEAYSAGIKKHGLDPLAVQVMQEADVDISNQQSNLIEELPVKEFHWVITLCGHANETCPFFPGRKFHKGFDDPPKLAADDKTAKNTLDHYRRVRDEIRNFLHSLPEILKDHTLK